MTIWSKFIVVPSFIRGSLGPQYRPRSQVLPPRVDYLAPFFDSRDCIRAACRQPLDTMATRASVLHNLALNAFRRLFQRDSTKVLTLRRGLLSPLHGLAECWSFNDACPSVQARPPGSLSKALRLHDVTGPQI